MDDKQRIALVERRTPGIGPPDPAPRQLIRYQLGNHLGSASLELEWRRADHLIRGVHSIRQYVVSVGRSTTETPKRYRYTGKERDEESGLYYHGARYYAPWLGRWTSSDPVGISAGTNAYIYAADAPITHIDPTGGFAIPLLLLVLVLISFKHDEPGGSDIRPVMAMNPVTAPIAAFSYGVEGGQALADRQATQKQIDSLTVNTGRESEAELHKLTRHRSELGERAALSIFAGAVTSVAPEIAKDTAPSSRIRTRGPITEPPPEPPVTMKPPVTPEPPVMKAAPASSNTGPRFQRLEYVEPTPEELRSTSMNSGYTARPKQQSPQSMDPAVAQAKAERLRIKSWKEQGREFRQDWLEVNEFDPAQPKNIRGWLRNRRRRVERGQTTEVATPHGKQMSHLSDKPAREGFDYSNSVLNDADLNALENKAATQLGYRRRK